MEDFGQERTEQATPRKVQKAREEGQVARSMELNSVVIITLGFAAIYVLGPALFANLSSLMRRSFSEAPHMTLTPGTAHHLIVDQMLGFSLVIGPFLLILAAVAYAINVAQVGVLFSTKSLEPKMDKFNLAKGFKRLLSKRSLIEMVRDILKTILISIVAYYTIAGWIPEFMRLSDGSIGEFARTLGHLSLLLALKISAVLFIVALFDFAFQRYDLAHNLKMTKQEVREELKDTEGNPLIKSRVRQVQREIARQRMMAEIPKADVVVTNPTAIAVALKYDTQTMPAPMVVAKGQRLMADRIREIARTHHVPIVENKPLARSLFKLVDIGNYIPATLYKVTAEVLAHIYRLRDGRGVSRG